MGNLEDIPITDIIDPAKFKQWLLDNVGEQCEEYSWDCFVCRSWRLYEELEAYVGFNHLLQNIDVDGKEIREHNSI